MGPPHGCAARRADLDFPAVQLPRRVQDQGAHAGTQLQDDAAGPGRAGNMLVHDSRQDAGWL